MTTLQPGEAYKLLARNYDSAPNPMLALQERVMIPLLPELPGATVIDVAAGTGRWAVYCKARGALTIAADFCFEMLAHAPRPAVLADANRLPFSNGAADLTICAFALGYAPACISELARITRRGGVVLVSDVHPDAIRRGWTRTFRHGGDVIEVAHQRYELEDLGVPGLKLDCLIEPKFGERERTVFAEAGKLAMFEDAARHAAIFVTRWTKT